MLSSTPGARLRAHVWDGVPHGPLLNALKEAVDSNVVHLSVGGGACPPDTEVCVLPPNILPDNLHAAASLARLRAIILPYAGLQPKHLDPLRTVFGERLGTSVALHNIHHNAPMTAEMAIALMLAAAKNIVPADRRLRAGDWRPRGYPYPDRVEPALPMVGLEGRTALILGLGGVGGRVAKVCAALGMHVVGTRRNSPAGGETVDGVETHPPAALHALLPRATVLLVCVPSTRATAGLIGAAELALLPAEAVLVNVARGEVINEGALYAALAEGRLRGAGLDVWWSYPSSYAQACRLSPSTYAFHELDSVVMSPHRGGAVGVPGLEVVRMRHVGELLSTAGYDGVGQMPHRWNFEQGY